MMKEQIEKALTSALGTHIGAQVPAQSRGVTQHMRELGLIGDNNGLTRAGSIQAMRLKRAEEERLFQL